MMLAGCKSPGYVAVPCPQQIKPAKVQTLPAGYFQAEWMKSLRDFKKGLTNSSKDATS
jgi:hypothetical protein